MRACHCRHPEPGTHYGLTWCTRCGSPIEERPPRTPRTALPLIIQIDTREQRPPPFPPGVETVPATMGEGDYSSPPLWHYARIERKSPKDYCGSLTRGRERLEREADRLRRYPFRCIVVEGTFEDCALASEMTETSLLGSISSLHARWGLPTLFLGSPERVGLYIAGTLRRLIEELAEWDASADAAPPKTPKTRRRRSPSTTTKTSKENENETHE